MYKISVITPVALGDEHYLKRCIEVVKQQKMTDIEWIIICNHEATSLHDDFALEKEDITINVVVDPELKTVSQKRNRGLDVAQGDYVFFFDCDDFLHPWTLKGLYTTTTANKVPFEVVLGPIKKGTVRPKGEEMDQMVASDLNQTVISRRGQKYRSSCVNALFKRSVLLANQLQFDEDFDLFSDMIFMSSVYEVVQEVAYCKGALYVKLLRNDAINDPSMSQRETGSVVYPQAVARALQHVDTNEKYQQLLYRRFLSAYHHKYLEEIYDGEDSEALCTAWASTFQEMDIEAFSFSRKIHKKEVLCLVNGDIEKARKLAKRRLRYRLLKKLIKKPQTCKRALYEYVFTKRTKVNSSYVLYESFLGRNYSDSPKYMYEYLQEHYPGKFKHIWVFNDTKRQEPHGAIKVKRFGLRHMYYMAKAKFHVNNMRQPVWFRKRASQVFVETWHGTPLKKLVFDIEEVHSANPNYKKDFYDQSRVWDYLVSANRYSTDIFRRAFMFDREILEYGYPRNDLLYAENQSAIVKNLKEKLSIPEGKKVVLYAPTWRDDEYYQPGQYKFELQLNLSRMKEELGDTHFIIIRTHYFIADSLDLQGVKDFVYNASHYDDVAELYLLSDILITDYSSVFFDYAHLRRPVLFYVYDFEKYRDTLRGFYINMETDLPGPLLTTTDEVIDSLKNEEALVERYQQKEKEFYERYCHLDDGSASQRVVEETILKHIK